MLSPAFVAHLCFPAREKNGPNHLPSLFFKSSLFLSHRLTSASALDFCESMWSNPSVSQPVKNSHNAAAPTVITQCSGGTSVTSLSLAKLLQQ